MINIPDNDYKVDNTIREDVVEMICRAYLEGSLWSTYHPFTRSPCRKEDKYILKSGDRCYGFNDEPFTGEEGVKFTQAEMQLAIDELVRHGYHVWKVYEYGSWLGYKVTKTPQFLSTGYGRPTEVGAYERNDI